MGLIISRRENEAIDIGDDIKVVVIKTSKSRVTVRIDAPDGVTITREGTTRPPECNTARIAQKSREGTC